MIERRMCRIYEGRLGGLESVSDRSRLDDPTGQSWASAERGRHRIRILPTLWTAVARSRAEVLAVAQR